VAVHGHARFTRDRRRWRTIICTMPSNRAHKHQQGLRSTAVVARACSEADLLIRD